MGGRAADLSKYLDKACEDNALEQVTVGASVSARGRPRRRCR